MNKIKKGLKDRILRECGVCAVKDPMGKLDAADRVLGDRDEMRRIASELETSIRIVDQVLRTYVEEHDDPAFDKPPERPEEPQQSRPVKKKIKSAEYSKEEAYQLITAQGKKKHERARDTRKARGDGRKRRKARPPSSRK